MFGKDMNSHMNKGNREATAVKCRIIKTKDHQNKGALWRVREWKQRWQHRTRQVQYSDTGAVGMGSVTGTRETQCHNEPTTQGWRLISVAALPPHTHPRHLSCCHPRETSRAVLAWGQQQALALMEWDGSEFLLGHTGAGNVFPETPQHK